jgi:hypothetical protein
LLLEKAARLPVDCDLGMAAQILSIGKKLAAVRGRSAIWA